ncbi:MAG: hypothetical protein Q8R13_00740 [bacterium]|nr:hypothetical protein [bacterium]MDZ4296135.1 hypothetical protein [Patescibacteria group bacterium]
MQVKSAIRLASVLILFAGVGFWLGALKLALTARTVASGSPLVLVVGEESIHMVAITAGGFSPAAVIVKKGEVVVWSNEGLENRWPVSDIHPSHELYPQFDPEGPIAPGEGWGFVFEKAGRWPYHDHLRPDQRGAVEVTE